MPVSKEFISGFDFDDIKRPRRKKTFDKSTVVPDGDISCFDCSNSKLKDVTKKWLSFHCEKKKYTFFDYWKQTIARDCDSYAK